MQMEHWGELPPVEGTMQITRSMLDMKIPRPYVVEKSKGDLLCEECPRKIRPVSDDPYVTDAIKLLDYIKEAELRINEISEGKSRVNLPKFPDLKPIPDKKLSINPAPRLMGFNTHHALSNVVCGFIHTTAPNSPTAKHISTEEYDLHSSSVEHLTKKAVVTIALHKGFDVATLSAVNILMDVTKQFLEGISCALRQVLDNEALTGRTGFYDSIDQVLHDNDIDGISSLQKYYKTDIISYYMALKDKSKILQNQLKSSKSKPHKGDQGNCEARENQSAINPPIKDETQPQSGWVPVHNTSGESVSTVIASTNPRWMPFVKIEPFNQSQLDNPITSFQPISSPTNTETSRPVRKKMRK